MAADPRDALVRITFQIDSFLGKVLHEKGVVTRAGLAAQNANREIAEDIQKRQLQNLIRSVEETGRPQRPTMYLVRALEDPSWISYNPGGFTVGTESAMTETRINAYWRGLEFGSERFMGREVTGYFRDVEGGKHPAMADRYRADPRLIQLGRGGSKHGRFPFLIHIHNPIPRYEFLKRGAEGFTPEVVAEVYQRWFGTLG